MAHIDFLSADIPLVKQFRMRNGELEKSPYPMVRDFTSHRRATSSIAELHTHLLEAANNGWCMLKGLLSREIKNEPRAGLTNPAESTQILLLDLDGLAGHDSIDAVLRLLGLNTYHHVIQWSASAHITSPSSQLSAHVFFWLTNPVSPQLLKAWITNACLTHFLSEVTLTRTGAALHWPIDPSVMDNSKLIYVAPPVLHGLTSVIQGNGMSLVTPRGGHTSVPTNFFNVNPQEVQRARMAQLNALRKAAGMSVIKDSQLKTSNGQIYLSKPGHAVVTGTKVERGYVYLNLNGGDSWGYWHPEDQPEYIYNFKGEPIYRTEELLPEYWAGLKEIDATRPQSRVRYFVCRDFRTDRLYNGLFFPDENRLDMARTQNEGRLRSFLKQHGQPVPDFVPDFNIIYNPHSDVKYDEAARTINTYVPSYMYGLKRKKVTEVPPLTRRVIESAVGTDDLFEHWINWFGDIVQNRTKIGTAWVWHGNEGTGKGVLFHHVIKPILGAHNVVPITMGVLDSPFNSWMEHALLVLVDEAQFSALHSSLGVSAKMRNFITEPEVSIRQMYTAPYTARNYSNFIFASNMADPVIIPPTDRRFHVGRFQEARLHLTAQDIAALNKEAESFFHYLMALKVDRERSRTIIHTEDRERLMNLSLTAADAMAATIVKGDLEDLVDNLPQRAVQPFETAYVELVKEILAESTQDSMLTRDELITIFRYRVGMIPDSPNKFTSFLKHHRIYTRRVRKHNRLFYGIEVTWKQSPEWMKQTLAALQATAANDPLARPPTVVPIGRKAKLA